MVRFVNKNLRDFNWINGHSSINEIMCETYFLLFQFKQHDSVLQKLRILLCSFSGLSVTNIFISGTALYSYFTLFILILMLVIFISVLLLLVEVFIIIVVLLLLLLRVWWIVIVVFLVWGLILNFILLLVLLLLLHHSVTL